MHLDGIYIEVIVALSSHGLQLVSQLVNLLLQGLHNCGWNGVKDKLLVLALQGLEFFTQIMIILVQIIVLVLQPLVKVKEGFCILQPQAIHSRSVQEDQDCGPIRHLWTHGFASKVFCVRLSKVTIQKRPVNTRKAVVYAELCRTACAKIE